MGLAVVRPPPRLVHKRAAVVQVDFDGVYLPIERAPSATTRNPLVLVYDASHFMPLVPKQPAPAVDGRRPVVGVVRGKRVCLSAVVGQPAGPLRGDQQRGQRHFLASPRVPRRV